MNKNTNGLIVWFIGTLFVVYAFFLNTAGAVFADPIMNDLKLSTVGTAIAIGSFILGFACMQIPAGYLLDRFPLRNAAAGGLFLLTFGTFLVTFATNLSCFALSNFVQGLGASFAFIAVGKIIGEWFAPKYFPILFGLTQTISCVLTAIVHYYLIDALEEVSWQTLYLYFTCFGFALLLATFFFVSSPPDVKPAKLLSFGKSLDTVCKNKQNWLCALAAATSFGVLIAYASFWYMEVEKYYLVDAHEALIISAMTFIGIGVGTPFFGWISNKIKSRRLAIHISVVIGTIFLMMGLYLPHLNIDSYLPIQTISFFIGFFLSGSMLYYTCISELATSNTRGFALGMINTFVFLFNSALLFIPPLFITESSTTYFTYLWVLPVGILISIFLAYFVKETYSVQKK